MVLQTICSIDLQSLGKRDLKALCQTAREEWGKPVDLRGSAKVLISYLENYKQWKIEQVQEQELNDQVEVPPVLSEAEASCDVLEGWNGKSCDLEGIDNSEEEVYHDDSPCAELVLSQVEGRSQSEEPGEIDNLPYWDAWTRTFEQAKRQLVGAVEASKHEVVRAPIYWNAWTRAYNSAVVKMRATRLGQLLKEEHEAECREWWANWEDRYDTALGKALKAVAPKMNREVEALQVQAQEQDERSTPVIVALIFLVAIAIMLDGVIAVVKWTLRLARVQALFKDVQLRFSRLLFNWQIPKRFNLS